MTFVSQKKPTVIYERYPSAGLLNASVLTVRLERCRRRWEWRRPGLAAPREVDQRIELPLPKHAACSSRKGACRESARRHLGRSYSWNWIYAVGLGRAGQTRWRGKTDWAESYSFRRVSCNSTSVSRAHFRYTALIHLTGARF